MMRRYPLWALFACLSILLVALQPSPARAGAKLTKNEFTDDFEDLESKYWTVDKFGGTFVGPAFGRLEFLIPPNAKGNPFWGGVVSRTGFSIKPDSLFEMKIKYMLLTWPQPDNGIRVAMSIDAYDKKNKPIIHLMAGRMSDPDFGEVYMVYLNGQYYYAKTKQKSGWFEIDRDLFTWYVRAGPLMKSYVPTAPYIGKITWNVSAWGHDWKFVKKSVRTAVDNFSILSEKGFNVPK